MTREDAALIAREICEPWYAGHDPCRDCKLVQCQVVCQRFHERIIEIIMPLQLGAKSDANRVAGNTVVQLPTNRRRP